MASLRDIRRRIRSVKNTRQITRAMELVAASKMRRAQQMAQAGRPFAELLARMLVAVIRRDTPLVHPFLQPREVRTRGILLVTTDRGLCGPLNANLFRLVPPREEAVRYVVVGRKGAQFLVRSGRGPDLLADFSVPDPGTFAQVKPAAEFLVARFLAGEVDTVEVLYPRFINTLIQTPVLFPLLPLTDLEEAVERLARSGRPGSGGDEAPSSAAPDTGHGAGAEARDQREMIFEPSAAEVLGGFLPVFVNREIHQFVLSAKASEHSARMVAMKTAKDNATKLVGSLTLQYNKARQAAITQEILEIAAATQAGS